MAAQKYAKALPRSHDVVIAGGGIAGLTLAVILAEQGLAVALIDPKEPPPLSQIKTGGRTVALMNSSLNIIKAASVWDEVKDYAAPLKTMRLIDISVPGKAFVEGDFPASGIGLDEFGFNVPNNILHAALYDKAKSLKNIKRFVPASFEGYQPQETGCIIALRDGQELLSSLLVGADGRNSPVRKAAQIGTWHTQYKQHAITAIIGHSTDHEGIAREFHRPHGPLALVPLPGKRSSIVWVNTPERTKELLHLNKQALLGRLSHETQGVLGRLSLETGLESWPLSSLKAKNFTAPRTALIAEAAHVMSPITAQGLNLSLRDIGSLAEIIIDARRLGLDIGSQNLLQRYEKRRRLDTNTRVAGVDFMNRLVAEDNPAIKKIRRTGLKLLDKLAPAKAAAMHIGLAPQLDQSRIARGEKL